MVLGTLSGSMVLGLGTAVLSDPTATPFSFLVLAGQVLILAAAALETAFLSDWINDDLRNRLVDGERMRAVGQTLAGVTHELSNPLSALVGYADMLAERVEGGEAGELVGKMRDQADRAAHILRCMRKFVRQQHSETAPFSAGALLNDVLDLFAYKARILGVSVSADVGEELAHVYADKQSVQQVLVNLHQNALQAVQKVEGERFVRIRVFEEDGEIWFCWRDNGHGIPEEIRKHVFEPFFTTKAPEEGTGLGLSISRGIARGQGGELHLEPDTGVGACFTLKLPRAASASESRPRQKSQVPDLHDLQVLVVDDEEHVRDTLGALVGKLGHVATCVDGVRGAENAIAQTEFDAILLDLRMPGKSGRAFYRTLTSLSPHIVRRVILMTGDVANADIAELADTWDTPILLKPFTQCELVEALALTVKASTATGESAAA
jgi:signal transduction histidine kinase/ActR/RegA family two-component response regulator